MIRSQHSWSVGMLRDRSSSYHSPSHLLVHLGPLGPIVVGVLDHLFHGQCLALSSACISRRVAAMVRGISEYGSSYTRYASPYWMETLRQNPRY